MAGLLEHQFGRVDRSSDAVADQISYWQRLKHSVAELRAALFAARSMLPGQS
ncbi:hypothetical protein ACP70R_006189 [Stipagrostis hirtigluma subsp. patula]